MGLGWDRPEDAITGDDLSDMMNRVLRAAGRNATADNPFQARKARRAFSFHDNHRAAV